MPDGLKRWYFVFKAHLNAWSPELPHVYRQKANMGHPPDSKSALLFGTSDLPIPPQCDRCSIALDQILTSPVAWLVAQISYQALKVPHICRS
jgi:hypothetical protein